MMLRAVGKQLCLCEGGTDLSLSKSNKCALVSM
jgi:hypothetical protein